MIFLARETGWSYESLMRMPTPLIEHWYNAAADWWNERNKNPDSGS